MPQEDQESGADNVERLYADVSGVLLAGGRSTRMGRDKSLLLWKGQPLWKRQIDVLRNVGVSRLIFSGSSQGPWAENPRICKIVSDTTPNGGPLAGLSAAFEAMQGQWLIVLAVDMPRMKAAYLRASLDFSRSSGCGCVPFWEEKAEPLAAVYPREMGELAAKYLRDGELSLQYWIREGIRKKMIRYRDVKSAEKAFFLNLNTPADFAKIEEAG